jgi:hypothetical protein
MLKWLMICILALATVIAPSAAGAEAREGDSPRPVTDEEWTPEARLWLARSVLGEVGWRRPEEYSAVAWVYATRARTSRRYSFLKMVRTYSAAVKGRGNSRNPWLYELRPNMTRPPSWPEGPRWEGLHAVAWAEVLVWANEWAAGKRPNPCPGANHFGGSVDHYRAVAKRWTRVKCTSKMRNRFYTSLRLRPKGHGGTWRHRYHRGI